MRLKTAQGGRNVDVVFSNLKALSLSLSLPLSVHAHLILTTINYNRTALAPPEINFSDMLVEVEGLRLYCCTLISLKILLFVKIPIKWIIKLSDATLENAVQHYFNTTHPLP